MRTVEDQSPPAYLARYAVNWNSRFFSGPPLPPAIGLAQPPVNFAIAPAAALVSEPDMAMGGGAEFVFSVFVRTCGIDEALIEKLAVVVAEVMAESSTFGDAAVAEGVTEGAVVGVMLGDC